MVESYVCMFEDVAKAIDWYLFYPMFPVLLGALVLLHVFWFMMFIQMGYALVFKGKVADYSEKNDSNDKEDVNQEHIKAA